MPSALEETLRLLSGHEARPHEQQAEAWGGAPDVGPTPPPSGRPADADDHGEAADRQVPNYLYHTYGSPCTIQYSHIVCKGTDMPLAR